MSMTSEESVHSLNNDQVQEIFGELHKYLGISVDFNSYEPYGLLCS